MQHIIKCRSRETHILLTFLCRRWQRTTLCDLCCPYFSASYSDAPRAPIYHKMLTVRTAWIFLLFQLSCFALKPAPPLNIASITPNNFTILENRTKTFGLQDAFNSHYDSPDGAITLFPEACIQSDGSPNCTAACLNNAQMFSNLETLHNCALFPTISIHLANNSLSANARRLAEELNIEPSGNESSLPSRISNAIQHCMLDSSTDNGAKNGKSPDDLSGILFTNPFFNPCASTSAYVIADVGGIGV